MLEILVIGGGFEKNMMFYGAWSVTTWWVTNLGWETVGAMVKEFHGCSARHTDLPCCNFVHSRLSEMALHSFEMCPACNSLKLTPFHRISVKAPIPYSRLHDNNIVRLCHLSNSCSMGTFNNDWQGSPSSPFFSSARPNLLLKLLLAQASDAAGGVWRRGLLFSWD